MNLKKLTAKLFSAKNEVDGVALIEQTLSGFQTAVENLFKGHEQIARQVQSNCRIIELTEQANVELNKVAERALKVRANLLTLMGQEEKEL